MRTVNIGGETFEMSSKLGDMGGAVTGGADWFEIMERYGRPSSAKVKVWHDWCNWAERNSANLTISAAGCQTFSIMGNVKKDGHFYVLWITRDHNRARMIF